MSFKSVVSLIVILLAGCGGGGSGGATTPSSTYAVIYNSNGSTGGSVPVDSTSYSQGQIVTVPGNSGNLVRSGFSFSGWNVKADGSGATYTQGQTLTIGSSDLTLFAIWTAKPTFTVNYDGNGNNGGTSPIDTTHYQVGQSVVVPGNTGNLVKSGYTFIGWNTRADGIGTTFTPNQSLAMGSANVTLYASWSANPPVPNENLKWSDAVAYQIVIDRFYDGDATNNGTAVANVATAANFQGGDLAGVTQRIQSGYFTNLGVTLLYLSSPVDSTQSSGMLPDGHLSVGYRGDWPRNLDQTEARYGTAAEMSALVSAAHTAGILVAVEWQANHVHLDSPLYTAHPDWFTSLCLLGSACSWSVAADKLRGWLTDYLPNINYGNDTARQYSVNAAVSFVQQTGIDGMVVRNADLIEDAYLTDLRSAIKTQIEAVRNTPFLLLGDVFTNDRALLASFVDPGVRFDGQTDLPLRAAIISSVLLRSDTMANLGSFLAGNIGYYNGTMLGGLGSAELPRMIHFAQDTPLWTEPWTNGADHAWSGQPLAPSEDSAYARVANAFAIEFTLPGIPSIYYGDEWGMPGAGSPDNLHMMQWSGTPTQTALQARVARLAAIRAAHPALRNGTWSLVYSTADVIAYQLQSSAETVLVVINRSDSAQAASGLPNGSLHDEISGTTYSGPSIVVPANSVLILVTS